MKTINKEFGKLKDGRQAFLYSIENSKGTRLVLSDYGATIVSLFIKDINGQVIDVALGHLSFNEYIKNSGNLGCVVGRNANRIEKGKLEINGVIYDLEINNGPNNLHTGTKGLQTSLFEADFEDCQVSFMKIVKHLEDGFPGNLYVEVTYRLTEDDQIIIEYMAKSDKDTIVNLTNHSYFNLSGNPENTILDDLLTINADGFTPVDTTFMTTGEIATVEGSDMDFRTATAIGKRIDNYEYDQLINGDGYDHNWVLNTEGNISEIAGSVYNIETGIKLDVYTDEPGLQVYTGNFLDGTITGKEGIVYDKRTAICLETQKYPDSPNKTDWPSPYLKPGENYTSRCIYKFSVR